MDCLPDTYSAVHSIFEQNAGTNSLADIKKVLIAEDGRITMRANSKTPGFAGVENKKVTLLLQTVSIVVQTLPRNNAVLANRLRIQISKFALIARSLDIFNALRQMCKACYECFCICCTRANMATQSGLSKQSNDEN